MVNVEVSQDYIETLKAQIRSLQIELAELNIKYWALKSEYLTQ